MWRRYLGEFGEVGKFYRTSWLIYPRHRTSIPQFLSKSVKHCRRYDKILLFIMFNSVVRGAHQLRDEWCRHAEQKKQLSRRRRGQ